MKLNVLAKTALSLLVDAELDSMGGIVDCGICVDAKTSPRRVAIEKAQEELRQEYDVREQRRKELEFLEKGGNPLDYKFINVTSPGVQSTSQTDQLADHNVISEAKGSFALAASPPADSFESSGRPGGSVGHEPNTADNISLIDGHNSHLGVERNVKHSGKRSNLAQLERSSPNDCSHTAKELDESAISRLGAKAQAYARRYRSRSSRDGFTFGSTDTSLRHGTRSSVLPSSCPDPKEAKWSVQKVGAEKHAVPSIYNSKPTSPVSNAVSETAPCEYQLTVELDGMQTDNGATNAMKGHAQIATGDKGFETMPGIANNKHKLHIPAERITEGTTCKESEISRKDIPLHSHQYACEEEIKDDNSADKVKFSHLDKSMINLHDNSLNSKTSIPEIATKAASANNKKPDSFVNMVSSNSDYADENENWISTLRMVDSNFNAGLKDQVIRATTASDTNGKKENGQLKSVDEPNSGHDVDISIEVSNLVPIKDEVDMCDIVHDPETNSRQLASTDSGKVNSETILEVEKKLDISVGEGSSTHMLGSVTRVFVSSTSKLHATVRNSTSNSELQGSGGSELKLGKKEYEDSILRKARIIEANLKRASNLSSSNVSLEKRQKCHWDLVLEEMAWMANDFMQERLWKVTAAAHVCHSIASVGVAKFELANTQRKQKEVARALAKAIMQFWHSAEVLRTTGEAPKLMHERNSGIMLSLNPKWADAQREQGNKSVEENSGRVCRLAIQNYAVRTLIYIHSVSDHPALAEAPPTPDRLYNTGILEVPNHLSEESLFYVVPPGAMQAYRDSIESQWLHNKKSGKNVHHEDCERSMCDSVTDGPPENAYEEDEGETCTYLLPGTYESGITSKFGQKRRKIVQQKACATRTYEVGGDMSYEPCLESKSGNQSVLNGKRPSGSLNAVTIPAKRVRTASRQRVVGLFSAGISGTMQVTSKTDVSSGDTNSYQDDQSSLHGGSLPKKNMEVESTFDFERQLPYDGSEVSTKPKKRKKPKHLGFKNSLNLTDSSAMMVSEKDPFHEQRYQMEAIFQHEQKEHLKKRSESQQFESSGNTVLHGQHATKKPKLLKQVPDITQEILTPFIGPKTSPVASHMSNMSNSNKLIRIITSKDRGRKSKALKIAAGHSGSGSPWLNFEDQALVVLVHDMGPNWELVSDAINSTLQFKCIFRKPQECKERHKFLMDKSSGDGADSAEDSGSSQPYPSTLPGIPKGSARQLFQRLQGPLEEDTLKAHFEKIILLGRQLHSRHSQNVCQDLKQKTPAHSSHVVALNQACQNNLSGGIMTPLDLCDAITSSPDVLPAGYQAPHTNGLAIPNNQGSVPPVLPTSNVGPLLQGSPGNFLGSNLPSPSAPQNGTTRDAQRYSVPRAAFLPNDEQQRIQQYNQMLPGRNLQQPGMSVPGPLPMGVDCGVHMLPTAQGMGMMCGLNQGMPMPRPGFQRLSSPGMLNMVSTGNMMPSSGHGLQNGANVHPNAISGPGNSMLRPRDPLQILRTRQNLDDHRQLMMQVSQGNGQAVHFNGISAQFSSATTSPAQTFPAQQSQPAHPMPQQPHVFANNPHHSHIQGANHSSSQQQAIAIRFAKVRQMQQHMMPHPQHPFSGSNSVSPVQNGSHIQQQPQPSPVALGGAPQAPHKQQHITQNPQDGVPNQITKHKQRQQAQQPPRQNQQQRQQSHQPAKLMQNLGRGNMLMHQNSPVDASQVSSYSMAMKNQVPDKGSMQQGQGFFPSSSGLNSSLPQPGNQAKMYPSLPQPPQMTIAPSHCESSNPGTIQGSSGQALLSSQQSSVPSSLPLLSHQQQRHQQQRHVNTSQLTAQRVVIKQNRQINSDGRIDSDTGRVQVSQMIPSTTIAHCTESSSSGVLSSNQWKKEPSYDTSTRTPTAQLASSPQENVVGNEMLMPSSGQGLLQRQISGMPVHGQVIGGGPWQQQQSQQLQQGQYHPLPMVQGNVYPQPSNSGPG